MKRTFCFLLILALLVSASGSCFADAFAAPGPTPTAALDTPSPSPCMAENGELIIAPDYEGTCEIKVIADEETDCYIYLEYLGKSEKSATDRELKKDAEEPYESDLAFYVKAGETVKMNIPVGIYQLYYAVGTVFYGKEDLFGDETNCFSADDLLEFYTKENHHYIQYTIEFYKLSPIDFMTGIPREDFPSGGTEP